MKRGSIAEAAGEEFGSELARMLRRFVLKTVTIESVDEENNVANVTIFEGDAPIQVPLSLFNIGTANVTIVPTVGSVAVIANPNGDDNNPQFLWFESVDKVSFKRGSVSATLQVDPDDESKDSISLSLGKSSIDVTSDLIQFNGGSLGALVAISRLTERLNKLKSELDTLQNNIATHTHPAPGGTTATPTFIKAKISSFSDDDYANEKIKQ
jgi:hypothetical protein|nr:MAG TPA: type VI secretion protein [Caudoviricetes sp.]